MRKHGAEAGRRGIAVEAFLSEMRNRARVNRVGSPKEYAVAAAVEHLMAGKI